jgi:26S proteasome regulatory subunit N2
LGEYGEALTFALGAGKLFDINIKNDYVETIVCKLLLIKRLAKCIDQYISKRQEGVEKIDSRLEDIVQKMFNKCYADGESEQVRFIS